MAVLSEIIGHKRQIESLMRAIQSGELPHALLFTGQPGLGKRTVAEAFASGLVCLSPKDGMQPCGTCRSCRAWASGRHPDVFSYEPAGAEATGIDQVRDLRERAHFAPVYGPRKVFIIPNAETMSPAAANCLLKTFEEPPGFVVIVMIAPSERRVFPTLVSRSRKIAFAPVPTDELASALGERFSLPQDEAQLLARTFCGRPGPAILSLLRDDFAGKRELFSDLAIELAKADTADVFLLADKVFSAGAEYAAQRMSRGDADEDSVDAGEKDADGQGETKTSRQKSERAARMLQAAFLVEFMNFLSSWFRDVLAVQADPGSDTILNRDLQSEIRMLAGRLSPSAAIGLLRAAVESKGLLGRNANSRLVLESLFWRIVNAHSASG
jgi:DNA polymerase-3 subunit delta'